MLKEFMERHRDLALGRVRSKEGRALSQKLWSEISQTLNAQTLSDHRSAKEWNKFYNDYKCRLKQKVRKIVQSQRQTGGGPADAPPLSALEERLCAIIAPDKFEPLPVQQNPLLEEQQSYEMECIINYNIEYLEGYNEDLTQTM